MSAAAIATAVQRAHGYRKVFALSVVVICATVLAGMRVLDGETWATLVGSALASYMLGNYGEHRERSRSAFPALPTSAQLLARRAAPAAAPSSTAATARAAVEALEAIGVPHDEAVAIVGRRVRAEAAG